MILESFNLPQFFAAYFKRIFLHYTRAELQLISEIAIR